MARVLITAELGHETTLEQARAELGLDATEVDNDFGLVMIRVDGLYALLVEDAAATRLSGDARVKGPFANPTISPIP